MGADDRPSRVRYQVLAVACSLAVVSYVHRVGFARALPKLRDDLSLGDEQVSLLGAAFLLAYGAFEIPWGVVGDRLGTRHLLTFLVFVWSLLTGAVALVVYLPRETLPFVVLLILRFLFGVFQAGAFPAVARMLTDWMPTRERGAAQGLIWTSARVGGTVIPLVLGWLIAVLGGWQVPLVLLAGVGVAWCALFWPWFRDRPAAMPGVNAAEQALLAAGRPSPLPAHGAVPWSKLLRSKSAWGLCLMYGCGGFAANFYVTLLPDYLAKHRDLSEEMTSRLSSLPFAFGIVACLLGGILSDQIIRHTGNRKWGRRLPGTVGTLLGGMAWLALGQASATWQVGVLLCLIFFCNDLGMGPAWASCADVGERYAGTLGGAMNMIGNVAGAAGNLVAGYFFGRGRPDLLFAIYAASFWIGTLCWQFVDVTRPLERHDSAE